MPVDVQRRIFETALHLVRRPTGARKQLLIVHGRPGCGKSMVAINLVTRLTGEGRIAQYVSKNSEPRAGFTVSVTPSTLAEMRKCDS